MDWEFLPNMTDICAYLSMNDKVKLSLVCNRYRKVLDPMLFSNLKLFKNGNSVVDESWYGKKRRYQLLEFLFRIEYDLKEKFHLVRRIEFNQAYTNEFATKFFKLFINLKSIKVNTNNEKFLALANTLKYSKNLIKIELSNNVSFVIDLKKLNGYSHKCRVIESLRRLEKEYGLPFDHSYRLEESDPIIQYLTKLTLFTPAMLENLNSNFPDLKEIKFNAVNFDPVQAARFINKNSQLQSIIFPTFVMNEDLVNSLFKLNELEYLRIDGLGSNSYENFPHLLKNKSIKRLIFNYACFNQDIFPLLLRCENLNVVELTPLVPTKDSSSYVRQLDWNTLTIQIPALYINKISNTDFPIDDFINSGKFNEFRFNRSWIEQNYIKENYESLLNSGEWEIINNDYNYNNYKFSLIKIPNQ